MYKKLISMVLIIILLLTVSANSIAVVNTVDKKNFTVIEYSEKYKMWLELPEEERQKTIAPPMYDIKPSLKIGGFLKASLPAKYDLRDTLNMTVENQMQTNSCWAFASNVSLETNIQKKQSEDYDFSSRFVEYATAQRVVNDELVETNPLGYGRKVGDGGNSSIAFSAYTSGNGPVLEEDMPFVNNEADMPLSSVQNKEVIKKITGYEILPSIYKKNEYDNENKLIVAATTPAQVVQYRETIKNHIMNYGAVSAAVFSPGTPYYNASTYASYYNVSALTANHAVNIVGWDDNYPVSNFNANYRPQNPGAYIVKNSWGTSFGDGGYYYVSYEDVLIESNLMGISGTEDKDYDTIYQYDQYGMNNIVGYEETTTMYGVNIFEKGTDIEYLNEVSVTTIYNVNCEVYVNSTDGSLDSNKYIKVGDSVNLATAGYHTIEFDTPVALTGNKFAVKVKYTSVDAEIAAENLVLCTVESPDYYNWKYAESEAGQSYISSDNSNWEDLVYNAELDEYCEMSLCLKAFTTSEIPEDSNPNAPTIKLRRDTVSELLINAKSNTAGSNIIKLKYAKGGKNIDYFNNHGTDVTITQGAAISKELTTSDFGRYTIYTEDALGNKAVKVIDVTAILLGDFYRDGRIGPYDAYEVLRFVVSGAEPTEEQLAAGDVFKDSRIKPYDAYMILSYIVGVIDEF